MSRRWMSSAVLAAALVAGASGASHAQEVPRTADGKPDFSGIYTAPSTVNATGPRGNLIFNPDKMAPVKPGAESLLYQPRTGDARKDEPRAVCLPSGFPSGWARPERRVPFSIELRKVLFRFGQFKAREGVTSELMFPAQEGEKLPLEAPRSTAILGHSEISTTMKYLHLLTEDLQRPHQGLSILNRLR